MSALNCFVMQKKLGLLCATLGFTEPLTAGS